MGEDVYLCASDVSLEAVVWGERTLEFILAELRDRFPGLNNADLHSHTPQPELWNVLLGIDRRHVHIVAYQYGNKDAASVDNSGVLFRKRNTRKLREFPQALINEFCTRQSITYDYYDRGKRIPTRVICAGSLVVVLDAGDDCAQRYADAIRAQGGVPHMLGESYRSPTVHIDPFIDDSWRKSL
jgi:hypothetical protein